MAPRRGRRTAAAAANLHWACLSRLPGKRAWPVLRGPRRGDASGLPDWRGAFYLLEDDLEVILVNAAHAKGLPGRKTDVCDASWLCQMGECGLLRASFVPPEPIRQLRDLTRYRTTLATERTREAQRLEKELEDAGIKLSSVATDILGVSGRAMLAALIARRTRRAGAGRDGQGADAPEDPAAGAGVDRQLR